MNPGMKKRTSQVRLRKSNVGPNLGTIAKNAEPKDRSRAQKKKNILIFERVPKLRSNVSDRSLNLNLRLKGKPKNFREKLLYFQII